MVRRERVVLYKDFRGTPHPALHLVLPSPSAYRGPAKPPPTDLKPTNRATGRNLVFLSVSRFDFQRFVSRHRAFAGFQLSKFIQIPGVFFQILMAFGTRMSVMDAAGGPAVTQSTIQQLM